MIDTLPKVKNSEIFSAMADLEHEQLVFCHDEAIGLKAIIAVHNTVLGPAMGGTRMWNYQSEEEAVKDVLRLSRGMTFKNAIAGLNIGGGKAVIIGDAKKIKNEALMRRFGKFVHSLNGKYWTAEDVNMNARDMEYVNMETPYVTGIPESMGGSGDPSPVTAYGVYIGMKASAKKAWGSDSLEGKKVVVQGAGHVGTYLIEQLVKEGAKVFVSDIFEDKLAAVKEKFDVTIVDADNLYAMDMDIYAPCALGATLNDQTIPQLKCAIVAGAANNQLDEEITHAKMLKERGIIYAPDFLINSGGITNVYYEQQGNYNRQRVYEQTERIYEVCQEVLQYADDHHTTTHEAALQLALNRINDVGKVKLAY
ncbi:Glu/Leu/Phe/Val dehydrogenase dimerization domain-containing protein [Marinoscillum furvescens]|uniref:Glutamate dehydrogenase/leucine dehydrogenase n=1 Tax=Marinoscillum furvescens DSM 4134 TaxID=1122208 RepID=A0A3D9L4P1_MARFU|nr:Glu/Leu/Phe/Val dehydrogenase dimerization domain-containing protein [Marinoscillum furvescens]REE00583.1 glutamate dehydrogenase/leucine dehydrogenase [Marinoscillum furvescens DSM 4134]